ncbi:MAG: type 1 glutamine amidotransferase [Trichlorobacter sp.]|uniref:type 1 glutamine amidotransferase n=1 Tax=Trichlorobacter sp. TaxID=2911007 RepID=UPI0025655219|nr:type 1 glutamine amidotransferase [Trichlorobacter sp.]MDK9717163.1 type 1 glutamine amidotransferase [Trichlorobacter sp.]
MLHIIIQNDPDVPPGNITENLADLGVPFQLHHIYRGEVLPNPNAMTALIVLGGAMGANDDDRFPFLYPLKQLIRSCLEQDIPYLGICLGGQLLAAASGTPVVSCRWEELGTLQVTLTQKGEADPLFNGIPSPFSTFQWHHDSFDLPDNALLLAGSTVCPHQAFRLGSNAWGLQFHPEVTEPIIRTWAAWDPATACRTEQLLADFQVAQSGYRHTAKRMLHNFLQM